MSLFRLKESFLRLKGSFLRLEGSFLRLEGSFLRLRGFHAHHKIRLDFLVHGRHKFQAHGEVMPHGLAGQHETPAQP